MSSNYILSLQDAVQRRYLEQFSTVQINEATETVPTEKPKEDYFFKKILLFTSSKDRSQNKTLANLQDAIKDTTIDLEIFNTSQVSYKQLDNGQLTIFDDDNKFTITDESNLDVIVITRLGAQSNEECIKVIELLQERGLFVINPIDKAQVASNKYSTAILLNQFDIPQPRFTLLTVEDILQGKKSLYEKLVEIYLNIGQDEKQDENFEYVIKVLNGHGGTGVFMLDGTNILPVLQAIFYIDPNIELLVQRKEEGDGGDIRVHVLTMRNKQTILAAMKRVKLDGGDFRSNVSLGAKAEAVELTDEQVEIAKKVAKISGMPWCAVDIMPLVKGSNKEIGDNVVLEYNASPGTEGISEVIGQNFIKLLFDSINDVEELVYATKTVPYLCDMTINFGDDTKTVEMSTKLDTGNGSYASTIGCDKVKVKGDEVIATIDGVEYKFDKHREVNPKVGQVREKRITVKIPSIQIGTRRLLDVEFALVDNRDKSTRVLLNRDIISRFGFVVSPNKD